MRLKETLQDSEKTGLQLFQASPIYTGYPKGAKGEAPAKAENVEVAEYE